MISRIWTVGAVALVAAILALGWVIGISPLLAQKSAADAERAAVESQTAAQQAQLEVMKEHFENLDAIRAELEPLRESIPGYEGVDVFAASVAEVAGQHGLKLASYVAGELPYGMPGAAGQVPLMTPGTGGAALSTAAGTVYALPITIGFEGSPEAVTDAVAELQRGTRLFLAQNLSFTGGAAGSVGTATVVGYLFLLTDRVLATTAEEAAAASATPGQGYQVPDTGALMPDWLSGGSGVPATDPTTGPTEEPSPTPTP